MTVHPEIDPLVAIGHQRHADGVYGTRLTGGILGACVCFIVDAARAAAPGPQNADDYRELSDVTPPVQISNPAANLVSMQESARFVS